MIAGYFIAIAVGAIAVMHGYGLLPVVLGVWVCGSMLSVGIAACITPLENREADAMSVQGPMQSDLSARELALWDDDLAAERYEADLTADRQETPSAATNDRKAG